MPVLGGAAGALAGARAGRSGAQRLGSLLSGIASDGLAATLSEQGLGRLVGGDRFTVLDALAGLIAGDGSDIDAQAARDATFDVLADLFPDADSWADLDAIQVDAGQLVRLLEMFLARYIYNRIPVIAERLARITDPAKAQRAEEDLQRMVESFVALRLPGDPLHVDWDGPEGRKIIEDTLQTVYEALEVLEDSDHGPRALLYQDRPVHAPADPGQLLLDWAPGSSAETIEFTPAFFEGWRPGPRRRTAAVRRRGVLRGPGRTPSERPDAWTRDLRVEVPVTDPAAWEQAPWPGHARLPHRRPLDPATAPCQPGGTAGPAGLRLTRCHCSPAASTRCAASSTSSNATRACGLLLSRTMKAGKLPPPSRPCTPG